MKSVFIDFFIATLSLILLNCCNKSFSQDPNLKQPAEAYHILRDTLNNYLKDNYWFVTDENNQTTCRPLIYICFQHIDNRKFVSFAMSPHILIDSSFEKVNYYKNANNSLVFCVLFDEKDSANTMFINNYPLEPLDSQSCSRLYNPCFYDGRNFLRSYEIANKKGGGDTMLLLSHPLTKWVGDPPNVKF